MPCRESCGLSFALALSRYAFSYVRRDKMKIYMARNLLQWSVYVAALTYCVGCEADYHKSKTQGNISRDRLTLGTVQREIKKGMASAEVIEALGSPNVVSTDDQGREVWIYDKHATDVVVSTSSWFVSAGAASSTQRTLTIIVKYDESGRVRDLAYHSTSF